MIGYKFDILAKDKEELKEKLEKRLQLMDYDDVEDLGRKISGIEVDVNAIVN